MTKFSKIREVEDDKEPKLGGNLSLNGKTVGSATDADLTKLNKLTVTSDELNYSDGLTGNIQAKFNYGNALRLKDREIDDSEIGNGKVLSYDVDTDKIKYVSSIGAAEDDVWNDNGDLLVGEANDSAIILPSSKIDNDVLIVDTTQLSGLNWKSLNDLVGVENDIIWDEKGDLAVGIGINRAINLKSGTNGQILSVDTTDITGLAWVNEITVSTDTIWADTEKGTLLVKTESGVTALPVGSTDYILVSDPTSTNGVTWKELSQVFNITNDPNWTTKGEIVAGNGSESAVIIQPGTDGYILSVNSAEDGGVKWVDPQDVFITTPINVVKYDAIWENRGEILYGYDGDPAGSSVLEGKQLPIGYQYQVLTVSDQGIPFWNYVNLKNNSAWDAKGDLLVGIDVDEAEILTVGDHGKVLMADDSVPLGLSWQSLSSATSVATDEIWDESGDLAVGSGFNQATRLAKGSDDQVLSIKNGVVKWNVLPNEATISMSNDPLWGNKGDIAVAYDNDTGVVIPVGLNGEVLMADSNAETGVKWANAQTGNSVANDLVWDNKGDIAVCTEEDIATVIGVGDTDDILVPDPNTETGLKWKKEIKTAPLWINTGNEHYSIREQIIAGRSYNKFIKNPEGGYWKEIRDARAVTSGSNGTCLMVDQSTYADYPTLRWADPLSKSKIWSGRYNLLIGHSRDIYGSLDSRYAESLPIGDINQQLTVKWHDGGEDEKDRNSYKYLAYDYSPALNTLLAKGDLLVASSANTPDRLPIGANNYVLTSDPEAPNLMSWKTIREPLSLLSDDSWVTRGDLVVGIAENQAAILSKGKNGQQLEVNNIASTGLSWVTPTTLATDELWYQKGDLVIGTGDDTAERYGVSLEYGRVLSSDPTRPYGMEWKNPRDVVKVLEDNAWNNAGDLLVGTGIDTGAILPVGDNNQVLVSDSGAALGVRWKTIDSTSSLIEFIPNEDITSTNVQDAIVEVRDDTDVKIANHANRIDNPHTVTSEQVGRDVAQWNADKIDGVTVNSTEKFDKYVLSYDSLSDEIRYVPLTVSPPEGIVGDILYYDGLNWTSLNKGDDGQFLKLTSGLPAWESGTTLPTGVSGDILYHNGVDWVPLNKGSDDQVLTLTGGVPIWADSSGGTGTGAAAFERTIEGSLYQTTLMYYRIQEESIISEARASVMVAPAGQSILVDIRKNGMAVTNSIFNSDLPIEITEVQTPTNGLYTSIGSLDAAQSVCVAGDVIYIVVTQVGSTVLGADLQVQVKF